MTHFWHPFADMAAVVADGTLTIVRGEGVHVWDDRDAAISMPPPRSGTATSAGAGARSPRRSPRRWRELAGLLDLRRPHEPARRGPRRSGGRDRAGPGLQGLLHQRRLGLDRHRHEDGPALLAAPRRARAHDPDPRARRPTTACTSPAPSLAGIPANATGHGDLIDDVIEVAWDDADALRDAIDAVGARAGRGVLLRTGHRRGRRVPAARRATCRRPGTVCRETRRAVRRRRGDHRVRPRAATGSRRRGSTSSPTSSPARRASRPATCRWARCSRRPRVAEPFWAAGRGHLAPRLHLQRPRDAWPRRRSPTSTSWNARICRSGPSSSSRTAPRRAGPARRARARRRGARRRRRAGRRPAPPGARAERPGLPARRSVPRAARPG